MGQEESTLVDESVPPETLTERSLSAVADYIKNGPKKRIVVLTGAGISTAAGIPDFRTPKTGLYNNLARLNLPYAEAVFDISYFRQHPEPFYVLAQELYPGKFHPTVSHAFIALLAQKGLLQMLFTQNIDCLERRAGVPAEKIIEAHGSFATQRCVECKVEFPDHLMEHHVLKGQVPRCEEQGCTGTVKPDIVFFGEALPSAFGENSYQTAMADVVLILGTSLTVYPFAGLPEMARQGKPRVLFNMERVGQLGRRADDVMELGSCDEGIRKLADELGWREELEAYWRGVVGHEEAEKQLRSAREREDEVEDEVQKLTAGVESALRFDDEPGPSGVERDETQAAERDEKAHAVGEKTPEVAKKDNSPVVDSEEKHEAAASGDLPEKVDESTADTESKQTSTKLPGDSSIKTESAASQAIDEEKEESKKPSL